MYSAQHNPQHDFDDSPSTEDSSDSSDDGGDENYARKPTEREVNAEKSDCSPKSNGDIYEERIPVTECPPPKSVSEPTVYSSVPHSNPTTSNDEYRNTEHQAKTYSRLETRRKCSLQTVSVDQLPSVPRATEHRHFEDALSAPNVKTNAGDIQLSQQSRHVNEVLSQNNIDIVGSLTHLHETRDNDSGGKLLYDAAVVCDKRDHEAALEFKKKIRDIAEHNVCAELLIQVFDSNTLVNDVSNVTDIINRSNFVFIYLTKNSNTTAFNFICQEAIGLTRLSTNATFKTRFKLRPVHTLPETERNYDTPWGLLTARGIEWCDKNSSHTKRKILNMMKTAVANREVKENKNSNWIQNLNSIISERAPPIRGGPRSTSHHIFARSNSEPDSTVNSSLKPQDVGQTTSIYRPTFTRSISRHVDTNQDGHEGNISGQAPHLLNSDVKSTRGAMISPGHREIDVARHCYGEPTHPHLSTIIGARDKPNVEDISPPKHDIYRHPVNTEHYRQDKLIVSPNISSNQYSTEDDWHTAHQSVNFDSLNGLIAGRRIEQQFFPDMQYNIVNIDPRQQYTPHYTQCLLCQPDVYHQNCLQAPQLHPSVQYQNTRMPSNNEYKYRMSNGLLSSSARNTAPRCEPQAIQSGGSLYIPNGTSAECIFSNGSNVLNNNPTHMDPHTNGYFHNQTQPSYAKGYTYLNGLGPEMNGREVFDKYTNGVGTADEVYANSGLPNNHVAKLNHGQTPNGKQRPTEDRSFQVSRDGAPSIRTNTSLDQHNTPFHSELTVVSRLTGNLIINPMLSTDDLEIDWSKSLFDDNRIYDETVAGLDKQLIRAGINEFDISPTVLV